MINAIISLFNSIYESLPVQIAQYVCLAVGFLVIVSTIVSAVWKEPDINSKSHKLWSIFHFFISFRLPPHKGVTDPLAPVSTGSASQTINSTATQSSNKPV